MSIFKANTTLFSSVVLTFILGFTIVVSVAQNNDKKTKLLTLTEVISIALEKSPDALTTKNKLKNNYWQHRAFKADYLPILNLKTTVPDLNRSISKITLPDGTDAFVESNLMNSNFNFSLNQNIGVTGGNVFVNTGIQRIDLLDDNSTSYLNTPVMIGYTQPLFSFNSHLWKRRIEPLRYEEAKKQYLEDMEDVAIKATNSFFDLFLAQINLDISEMNQSNNDTLYKIARGRYNLGKIAENELLQMELSLLNANTSLAKARLDVQSSNFKLKSFLGFKEVEKIDLITPIEIPAFQVNVEKAIGEAKKNRPRVIAFERQLLEAKRDLLRAKRENRFKADLYASYSLSQRTTDLSDLYVDPQDNEKFRFGINVPILDWGKSKAKVKMAEANQELVQTNVNQQKMDFEQEIYLKVMQFNMQRDQMKIAVKADTIAQKRYEVTKQRYLIGKINITDLNIALTEKDQARRSFIQTLRTFWVDYYDLRKSTLYDFENDQEIVLEEELK